jgi:hypothetical protein|tara:strand:- start:149 stop:802 length:654 start_codon:yes stop_codon:yes gene_type:complete
MIKKEKLVKSKQRTIDFGEVNTGKKIVEKMLDLVKPELERIDSRFLEPACGDGNFLCEILTKKLNVVQRLHGKQQLDYEKFSILACSSIYGIELLSDNVQLARKKLLNIFTAGYTILYPNIKKEIVESFKFILSKNIVQGDALSFLCGKNLDKVLTLSEWSLVENSFKRREFAYKDFISYSPIDGPNLFSDLGEEAFLPEPVKDYPLVKYFEIYEQR